MKISTSNEKWISFCQCRNMRRVRFERDVLIHWNFTYKILCQSDEYKVLLCNFMRYNISSIILHLMQWHMCSKF